MIVLMNIALGVEALKNEKIGLLLSAVGVTLIIFDPHSGRLNLRETEFENPHIIYYGLILSSLFGAFYLILNEKNSMEYPVGFLIFFTSFELFIMSSIAAMLMNDGSAELFSMDAQWGCFGFLNFNYFVLCFVMQGILSGIFGG